jgi:hypothetical protein
MVEHGARGEGGGEGVVALERDEGSVCQKERERGIHTFKKDNSENAL